MIETVHLLLWLMLSVVPTRAAFIGDSILAGTLVTTKPPTWVATFRSNKCAYPLDSATTLDYAVSGDDAEDCLANWNDNVRGTSAGVLFLACGLNSIHAGVAEATIEAQLDEIAEEAVADGLKLVWSTIWPCDDYAGCSGAEVTTLAAVNSHIATKCASLGTACTMVDTFTRFKDAGSGIRDGCDIGDGLHPNEVCTQEWVLMLGMAPNYRLVQ